MISSASGASPLRITRCASRCWSFPYPGGHCAIASLTLAPTLRAATELNFRVHIGWVNGHPHAWLYSAYEELIVDPTVGQFEEGWDDEPWLVIDGGYNAATFDGFNYEMYRIFDINDEEMARRTIKPKSTEDGWGANSAVKLIFKSMAEKRADAVSQA